MKSPASFPLRMTSTARRSYSGQISICRLARRGFLLATSRADGAAANAGGSMTARIRINIRDANNARAPPGHVAIRRTAFVIVVSPSFALTSISAPERVILYPEEVFDKYPIWVYCTSCRNPNSGPEIDGIVISTSVGPAARGHDLRCLRGAGRKKH